MTGTGLQTGVKFGDILETPKQTAGKSLLIEELGSGGGGSRT